MPSPLSRRNPGARPPPRTPGPSLRADSLAYALRGAARIGVGVRAGRTLREGLDAERVALHAEAPGSIDGRSDPIGAIHDIAARSLRRRGAADALLLAIAQRVPEPALLRELLVVAIALVIDALDARFAEDASFETRIAELPYSPFTLVNQAVQAATAEPELARAKGLVNAVLRTLLRRLGEDPGALRRLIDGQGASAEARYELPAWWIARLRTAYPDRWSDIAASGLGLPPLVLRVNRRKSSRDAWLAYLSQEGVSATAIGDSAIRLDRAMPVARIPGFDDGIVSVQDEAAQRAAFLLDVRDGQRVLDACAAPGGKTGHLLELADLDLTAIDVDAVRLARVRDNLVRLGLDRSARLVTGDAARPGTWWDGVPFDRILVDVPCTASGILRRHPDIRWLRRENDIASLSRVAQHITDALWSCLGPGGKFLLVTCSVFPEESVRHAEAFAARHPDAIVLPAPGQLLPTRVESDAGSGVVTIDHDGLFFALFEKMR